MERITIPGYRYHDDEFMDSGVAKFFNRLAAYEDTGLTPEEIRNALDVNDIIPEINVTVDHIRDLLQAEKDGRLVVLPCKVGDTVYRVLIMRDCPPVISDVKIKTVGQAADLIGKIGKRKLLSYYLTREEAEAALALEGGTDEDSGGL